MPKPSPTQTKHSRPNALEMFTDRVSEQAILARLLAPCSAIPPQNTDFLTVFYGVGGVGKSTLCRRAMETCAQTHPKVVVALINLDTNLWNTKSPFAHLIGEWVHTLLAKGVQTRLAQALLLIYSRVDAAVPLREESSAVWQGALSVLDQATQAIGIPGFSLVVQGAQWLKDRKQQSETETRLKELGLWPDWQDGHVNLADLEKKLGSALFEDLREWARMDGHLRFLIDGFERIQGHERHEDCQLRLQQFIGYFAADEDAVLRSRLRFFIFGREKLRWDELYEDPSWNDYWTQHLLGGLGEADARDYLRKHAQWLEDHGDPAAGKAVINHSERILDAADERIHNERTVYPFYLELAVEMVRDGAGKGSIPDLGRTPTELRDRFLRYLPEADRHLLKILALAETFDADVFDALVREQRVTGHVVGGFRTAVAEGRSYVICSEGSCRFHRLMEDALQDQWLLSQPNREQGCKLVAWLLEHLASRFQGKQRRDWSAEDLEIWRRGVEIIISQGEERDLMDRKQTDDLLSGEPWKIDFPATFDSQEAFLKRRLESREKALGAEHPDTLTSVNNLGILLRNKGDYDEAEALCRRALEGYEKVLGAEHPDTLRSVNNLGNLLSDKGDYDGAEALYHRALEGREKVIGAEHPDTLWSISNLGTLMRDKGDYVGAEPLYRRALEGREKVLGAEHPDTLWSVYNLGICLSDKGDHVGAEALCRRALEGFEIALGAEHPDTLWCVNNLGIPLCDKGDYDGAEALYRRALEGREKVLGAEHPDTLLSVNNLGILLRDKGDYNGAEALCRRAWEGREKVLGAEHPDTLWSVNNLGILLRDKGDYDEAEALCRRALEGYEKVLGAEHPDTLRSVNNLGILLRDKGDYDGAEALYRRALDGYEKVLGTEHPDTLWSVNNLGILLSDTRRRPEALALLRRFSVLSDDSRAAVAYNFACYECLEGNHEEAKRLISEHLKLHPEEREQTLTDEDFTAIRDWISELEA